MTNEIATGVKEEIKRMIDWMKKQELSGRQIEEVTEEILNTQDDKGNNIKKIFIAGLGRSGFVAKGFAMRLAHLGFNVRMIDEATVPPFERSDLFIIISGSGASLTEQIKIARKKIGAKIIVITSIADSKDAKLADVKFIIPGREREEEGASLSYDERQIRGLPVFPLRTAFEDFAMIVLDAIISTIAIIKKKTEEDLQKKHSNIPERA